MELLYLNRDTNLLDYSTWVAGTSGTTGIFTEYNVQAINSRIIYTDPFNNDNVAWKTNIVSTGLTYFRGGYTTSNILIDNLKSYRCSFWVNKNDTSANNKAYIVNLANSYSSNGTTQVNMIDLSSGSSAANYAAITYYSSVVPNNKWCLFNFTIRASNWSGTTDSITTGVYSGGTLLSITNQGIKDYKFITGTTYIKITLQSPIQFATAHTGATYQIMYPRIDCLDGTEPSIATLLRSEKDNKLQISNVIANKIILKTG